MKLCTSLLEIPELALAATVGNFDGVHAGHRYMLKQLYLQSKKLQLSTLAITFSPHPRYILEGGVDFKLINSLEYRRKLLAECDVDYLWEIPFNRAISLLTPQEFFFQYLAPKKNAGPKINLLSLGYDFTLGHNKAGDIHVIEEHAKSYNIEVIQNQPYAIDLNNSKTIVSSGKIREFVTQGDVDKAQILLDRPFSLIGCVIRCNGRGRMLGFPTANISIDSYQLLPKCGVYATQTFVHGLMYDSVTNVGFAPSFSGPVKLQVETHLFDFNVDIYGREIQVHFIKRIRDEIKFNNVLALSTQIAMDKKMALEILDATK